MLAAERTDLTLRAAILRSTCAPPLVGITVRKGGKHALRFVLKFGPGGVAPSAIGGLNRIHGLRSQS